MAQLTDDKKGLKRVCQNCGTKYYDFNKRPVVCPSCDAEFTGMSKVKSRRSRAGAAEGKVTKETVRPAKKSDVDEDEDLEEGDILDDDELENEKTKKPVSGEEDDEFEDEDDLAGEEIDLDKDSLTDIDSDSDSDRDELDDDLDDDELDDDLDDDELDDDLDDMPLTEDEDLEEDEDKKN